MSCVLSDQDKWFGLRLVGEIVHLGQENHVFNTAARIFGLALPVRRLERRSEASIVKGCQ